MTTGREILTSRSIAPDRSGTITARRKWTTEATSASEAEAWLSTQGVTLGSAYPGNTALILDKLDYAPTSDGTFEVSGDYSPSGLFIVENVNKQNAAALKYVRWRFGTYDYTIDIPWQMRIRRTTPAAAGGATIDVWTQNKQVVSKTDLTFEVEIRCAKLTLQNVAAIAGESNNQHVFPSLASKSWKFIGGSIQNVTDTEDLVTYTWRGDSGDFGYGTGTNQNPYNTQGGNVAWPGIARPQHCVWIVVPDPAHLGDPTFPFLFDTAEVCSRRFTGYNNLPYLTQAVTL